MSEADITTKKSISQPPLDLLFNPSVLSKKDVWEIDVSLLLEMLLKLINNSGKKDLRMCGIAALSSSLIYRLKVESILRLEKISKIKKGIEIVDIRPIPNLKPIEIPFRIEPTYPVTLEELLRVLENMINGLANPKPRRNQLNLESVETFNFDEYLVKFEKILASYENMIYDIVTADKCVEFKNLTLKMNPTEIVRCFIAILYLAMKRKIFLEQNDDGILISLNENID
ncbi:MAG: chromosome segregation protein ScpA [Thaumarchaeota archaeon]|jgi:segregation and condensation protein A|nr:MAG: chromosome segregation protein ScpA [Nitrososphaerota archaeon]TLX87409.1 MAG: chromosome segregation protein ScpA [Nitrososphaerota archaeon]